MPTPQNNLDRNTIHERFTYLVDLAEKEEARGVDFAIAAWSNLAREFPQRPAGHTRLAWCYKKKGDLAEAVACFQKVLDLAPNHVGALRGLSATLMEQEDHAAALRYLDAVPDTGTPQDKRHVFHSKLTCLMNLGRGGEALSVIKELLEASPEDGELIQMGINVANQHGYSAEAQELGQRALRLDPSNTLLRQNIAQEHLNSGQYSSAFDLLKETVSTDTKKPAVRIALCRCLIGLDRYDEARSLLRQVLKKDPQSVPACQLLSRLESITLQPKRAVELMDELGSAWQTDPDIARAYLLALSNAGEIKAEFFLNPDVVRLAEDNVDLGYTIVMNMLVPFKDYEAADRLSKKIHENFPNNITAMSTRAVFLNAVGRCDEASRIDLRPAMRARYPKTLRQIVEQPKTEANKDLEQNYQASIPIAWEQADQSKYSYEEWLELVTESTNRAELFFKVLQSDPDSADSAYELIDREQREKVREFFPDGKAALVVGFHDNFPTPVALKRVIPSYHYTSHWRSTDNGDLNGYDRITDRIEANSMIKDVKSVLNANKVVGIAIDLSMRFSSPTATVRDRNTVVVAKRKMKFRTLHGALVRQTGLPCYAVRTSFKAGKLFIDIQDMPRPEPGEPMKTWNDRWHRGIEKALRGFVRSEPEIMNLTSPIWRSLVDIEPTERED